MNCASCGHPNRPAAKFCEECASPLSRRCTNCSSELRSTAKFCDECGTGVDTGSPSVRSPLTYTPKHLADKILQSKSAIEGERKQVTVLFADVKGSMELAEQLDPEDWHKVLDRFFEILSAGVHRFEGTVNQYTGDGIMALFGAPIAHEDHAQRACYAALYLQVELATYATSVRRQFGIGFSTRLGINSGEVVVGRIGSDLRMDYTAQGHTVGLAQRVESLAEPNCCNLSAATAHLVKGYFELGDLGEFSLKGASELIRIYRLQGLGRRRTRLDIAHSRGLTRLIGRRGELQMLESALKNAQENNAPIIGIVGDPGLGKSRLCFEFMERCRALGFATFETTGISHGKSIPFLPMQRLFRSLFAIADGDSDAIARERIVTQLLAAGGDFEDSRPVLFDFLGVPDPLRPALRMDPDARQRQLVHLMRRVILQHGRERPPVLLLEDLHWFDGGSAALLEPLIEALQGTRSLVLLNFRPEYRAPWLGKSFYHQLPVSPLGSEGTQDLLNALIGADPSLSGLAQMIHEGTAGNPFFTEEVVQNLLESGKLLGSKGACKLMAPVATLSVPGTVHSLLAARIDRLSERDKAVLQTAAVIGREFDATTLAAVLTGDARELRDALESLKNAEFIFEQSMYPLAQYLFKHPLTHEVALNSQLNEKRKRLHARVAQVLEAAHREDLDAQAALLAHHREQADEPSQAAVWHKRAAHWAGVTNAQEAERHWQRARSLVRALSYTDETIRLGIEICQGLLGLAWRLGTSTADATVIFDEGKSLAERTGDMAALAALNGIYACVLGLVDGLSDEYLAYSREAIRLADQTEDKGLQIAQRAFFAFASVFSGRLVDGIESCANASTHFPQDPVLGIEFTGYSPLLGIMMSQAWMLLFAGRIQEGEVLRDRTIQLAHQHADYEVSLWLHLLHHETNILRADAQAAQENALQAIAASEKSDTAQARHVGLIVLGTAQRLNGDWRQAVTTLESALQACYSGANREFEGSIGAELTYALLEAGEVTRAEQTARAAIDAAHKQCSRVDELRANLALTKVLFFSGDESSLAEIRQRLDRALALINETGAKLFLPNWHECRSRLAELKGDSNTAGVELRLAMQEYDRMGARAQVTRLSGKLSN